MNDKRAKLLEELAHVVPRSLKLIESLEEIEHRVGIVIAGGRQQLDNLVGTLRIRELQAEQRHIRIVLERICHELKDQA